MDKRNLLTVAMVLACGAISFYPFQAHAGRQTEEPKKQETFLMQYLVELGNKYNCFFTIEEAWRDGDPMNKMESYSFQKLSGNEGLQLALGKLRRAVSNFTFEIDKRNPRIVHIIDARLIQQKEYGLEKVLSSIDFKGNINDLVTAISRQGVAISPPVLTDAHEGMTRDSGTIVQMKGKELKVRDVLSNSIPLEGRGRILWIARTKLGKGEVSYVQFRGQKRTI